MKPPSSLKGALPEGPRNLPENDSEKGRNSLTWFSYGSGAILAPEPLGKVPFLLQECLRLGFLWTESMRRGRDPSRTPSRPRRPVFDNPRGQLPGTGIRSDAENLYSGNLYRGSAQGVSGNSSGGVAVDWRVSIWRA